MSEFGTCHTLYLCKEPLGVYLIMDYPIASHSFLSFSSMISQVLFFSCAFSLSMASQKGLFLTASWIVAGTVCEDNWVIDMLKAETRNLKWPKLRNKVMCGTSSHFFSNSNW